MDSHINACKNIDDERIKLLVKIKEFERQVELLTKQKIKIVEGMDPMLCRNCISHGTYEDITHTYRHCKSRKDDFKY